MKNETKEQFDSLYDFTVSIKFSVFVRTNVIKNLQLYYLATITENFIETVKSYKLSNCSLVSFFIFIC